MASPAARRSREKHVVATLAEMPPGARKLVTVGTRKIALFNIDGAFFAVLDKCPHQGGSLCKGRLIGLIESSLPGEYRYSRAQQIVRCPWHGWEFDLATGQSKVDPSSIRVRPYPVEIESGQQVRDGLKDGPYKAEVFEVSVENDYVVIAL
jgi:nitrite reductase/ring-hydroxylating ferredoxin subunit